jgi:hypothetical protein
VRTKFLDSSGSAQEKTMLQLLITFAGVMTRGNLVRKWGHDTALLGFEGMLGPYTNFMPLYWHDGAYRDLLYASPVGIIRLVHLPPNRLNGVRVCIHRQLSPEPAQLRNGEERLP